MHKCLQFAVLRPDITRHDAFCCLYIVFFLLWFPNHTPSERNESMNEKPQSACVRPMFCCFFSSLRGVTEVWHHVQIETVITGVSTVLVLRSRVNPRRLHGAIYWPSMNWTYGDTGFYSGQTSYLNMKYLHLLKMRNAIFLTTANLSFDQKMLTLQWPHKLHSDLQLWSLV